MADGKRENREFSWKITSSFFENKKNSRPNQERKRVVDSPRGRKDCRERFYTEKIEGGNRSNVSSV